MKIIVIKCWSLQSGENLWSLWERRTEVHLKLDNKLYEEIAWLFHILLDFRTRKPFSTANCQMPWISFHSYSSSPSVWSWSESNSGDLTVRSSSTFFSAKLQNNLNRWSWLPQPVCVVFDLSSELESVDSIFPDDHPRSTSLRREQGHVIWTGDGAGRRIWKWLPGITRRDTWIQLSKNEYDEGLLLTKKNPLKELFNADCWRR
jgi:hypothetical protein